MTGSPVPDQRGAEVVDLRTRSAYRPDLANLARGQLAAARMSRGLSSEEFAELLEPLLGWPVTASAVEAWETTAVPPGDVLVAAGLVTHENPSSVPEPYAGDLVGQIIGDRFSDVTAVYAMRSEFVSNVPTAALFNDAQDVRAAGLSLNVICQQYSEPKLRDNIEAGATYQCAFLDPAGRAIKAREIEEGYPPGHLSALTELNIQTLVQRVRNKLSPEARERLQIRTYDEVIRFNILLIDGQTCVIQPYLPEGRGVDSPTIVVSRRWPTAGLYPMFDQVFAALWERSQIV